MKHLYVVMLLLLLPPWARAGGTNHFDRISLNEGLSQSGVTAVLQDSQGFVWLGTQDGLNRYDGYQIKQFHHDPFDAGTLVSDEITVLFEDSRRQLWVGTRHGLCHYDRQQGRFVRQAGPPTAQSEWAGAISGLVEDAWNTLWAATPKGLWRLLPDAGQPHGYRVLAYGTAQGLAHERVHGLHKDARGRLWAATERGLDRLVVTGPAAPGRQQVRFQNAALPASAAYRQSGPPILALGSDRRYLWVASGRQLFGLDMHTLAATDFTPQLSEPHAIITTLHTDRFGVLWVGTFADGLYHYRPGAGGGLALLKHLREERSLPNGLKSSSIFTLYESREPHEDIVWIGTREAGVQLYSRSKNSFRQWGSLLSDHRRAMETSVFSIATDSYGALWVGTFQGLFQIDRRSQAMKKCLADGRDPRRNMFMALFEDSRRTLWVGGGGGLFRYDRPAGRLVPVPLPPGPGRRQPAVRHIYEDRAGNVWVATYLYMARLPGGRAPAQAVRHLARGADTLHLKGVNAVQEDAAANLWIGTEDGLVKWNPADGTYTHFRNDPANVRSLIGNTVLSVHRDARNQLWVCSPKGLSRITGPPGREAFVHYTKRHGLPNAFVYGALHDDRNRLWLSTNAGLSCFDAQAGTFKNYDTNDGLANREFNSGAFHRSRDGELFFGGQEVLVSFRPERLVANRHLPRTGLARYEHFQRETNYDSLMAAGGELQVKYRDFLAFHFFANDYSNPVKNRFAFRLTGLQDEWLQTGNRYFGIADVKPGHYTLLVKSANNQGRWNHRDMLRIRIHIVPPYWQAWWFYTLLLLASGVAAYSFYRYRVRMNVRRVLALERIKAEESERVRKLAAQDLHDEFGNGLTRIAVLAELIRHKLDTDTADVRYLLGKINDNAQRLYQGTKDFVWTINPDNDNFYEIALRLKDFGDDVFEKTGSTFKVQGLDASLREVVFPMGASRHLIMIFKEAMSNTLKYAQATETELAFARNADRVEVRWHDNGRGFDTAVPVQSNGLVNMRGRAEKIGGNVEIRSRIRGGTTVAFTVKSPRMGDARQAVY